VGERFHSFELPGNFYLWKRNFDQQQPAIVVGVPHRFVSACWHYVLGSTCQPLKKINAMKNSKSNGAPAQDTPEGMSTQLGKLFEDSVRDIYWAEKALLKALPKMSKNATSEELVNAIETHITQTEEQVARLEQVFSILGKEPRGKKCEAMEGLIKEGETVMEEAEEGPMRDAGIIAAAQKVEHYEIAAYGTLRTYAQTLGLDEAVSVLEATLEEEKQTDSLLNDLAVTSINLLAASEPKE
jgi:ferritin-like metal-binding protein YciE